jgi:hypothetical protein
VTAFLQRQAADADEVADMNGHGRSRRGAAFGWIGALTGLLGAAPSSADAAPAAVSQNEYRPADAAPESWQVFSRQLQRRFQEQLAADDMVQQLQDALAERARAGSAAADVLAVRAWILPSGQIARIEFGQIAPLLTVRLRTLLSRVNVGAPPPDMLQPVHVRLLLRPNAEPEPDHPAHPNLGRGR